MGGLWLTAFCSIWYKSCPTSPNLTGWVVVMTLFAYFLIPETKGVPVERVPILFARHALWSRVMGPVSLEIIERDATRTISRQAAADQRAASNGDLKKAAE